MSLQKRKIYSHERGCETAQDCDDVDEIWFELAFC